MEQSLVSSLPLPQRLALSYAPAASHGPTLALMAFDARLGHAVRQSREPLTGQIRLAWWSEQLRLEPGRRERSDAVAAALDQLAGMHHALPALVEGWELLLGEELGQPAIDAFARARGGAFAALAGQVGAPDAGENVVRAARRWALADLAEGVRNSEERARVVDVARGEPPGAVRLSRRLRPLAVLEGLARRSIARGGAPLIDGPGSLFVALRLGLAGR